MGRADRMPVAPAPGDWALSRADEAPDAAPLTVSTRVRFEPQQIHTISPCVALCAAGGDVRGWIGVIAQRRRLGLSDHEAYARAWRMIAAVNPFAATLGRICPHPCESGCLRTTRGGAVAINALERFLGDWALRRRLALPVLETRARPESVGVIGAGPAGLSFAYQMARRGYRVTVYEKRTAPGGMLKHAIPRFRLPAEVLDAEIRRVLDVGVDLALDTVAGRDISPDELLVRHAVLFVGIGAARGVSLDTPGGQGNGVWLGVEYLARVNGGESIALGSQVVVVGGGNTAIDAARVARRSGARVTVLYRRTSAEMPANVSDVEAALSEGVAVEFESSMVRIERSRGIVARVVAQRMQPAGTDVSGRLQFVPRPQTEFTLPADAVIVAVSQQPDWSDIEEFNLPDRADAPEGIEWRGIRIVAGGDVSTTGIAASAIAQGRRAAESVHAKLRSLPDARPSAASTRTPVPVVKGEYYGSEERARVSSRPVRERLAEPDAEIEQTLGEQAFLGEVMRCFSCGSCFGCERCFMYCSAAAFSPLATPVPGRYFALRTDRCEGCGKCVELCPSGFLSYRFPGQQSRDGRKTAV